MAVIDLTGRSTPDLSGVMRGLEQIFAPSEEERLRTMMLEGVMRNPQLLAAALRSEQEGFREGNLAPGIGDANVPSQLVAPDTVGSSLGIPRGLMGEIQKLFPPTVQEQTEKEQLKRGLPGKIVDVQVAETEAALPEAKVRQETAESQLRFGLPAASAEAQLLSIGAQNAKSTQEKQFFEDYGVFVASLPPKERARAAAAAVNPGFLSDQMSRAQLDLAERRFSFDQLIAEAAMAKDEGSQFGAMFDLKRKFLDEFRNIEAMFREEELSSDARDALIARYNQLSDDYIGVFPNDPITILDPVEALMGSSTKDAKFRTMLPQDVRRRIAAVQIHTGAKTIDDLIRAGVGEQDVAAIQEIVNSLKTRSQKGTFENFVERLNSGFVSLQPERGGLGAPSLMGPQVR